MAIAREQQGDYPKARETYENILEIAPSFIPATKGFAMLCAQHLADDKRAYELASKVRQSLPDDPDVARILGILTYRLGKDNSDFTRSAQLLRQSAIKRTDDSELFYYLGLAEYQSKQLGESKKALQRALALNLESRFADDARRVLAKLN
jgi:tetratricopeptide (TPR) repeat protein